MPTIIRKFISLLCLLLWASVGSADPRFDGIEISKEVETEYDKQVQRFRLNAG